MPRSLSHIVFVVAFAIVLQEGCANPTESASTPANVCQIHLQNGLNHTPVTVNVDYTQVFSDTVTSGRILALAAIISLPISNGPHMLSITVADSTTQDTTFAVADSLYIGVNYDATTSRILCVFQRQPFYYR